MIMILTLTSALVLPTFSLQSSLFCERDAVQNASGADPGAEMTEIWEFEGQAGHSEKSKAYSERSLRIL